MARAYYYKTEKLLAAHNVSLNKSNVHFMLTSKLISDVSDLLCIQVQ